MPLSDQDVDYLADNYPGVFERKTPHVETQFTRDLWSLLKVVAFVGGLGFWLQVLDQRPLWFGAAAGFVFLGALCAPAVRRLNRRRV